MDTRAVAYFPPPAGVWRTEDPADAGWDADLLDEALRLAAERFSTGAVVLHGGRILAEAYWHGADRSSTRDVASVQKSIVSVLIGLTQQADRLHLDDPVSRWLGPDWSGATPQQEGRITLRHLMSMTSGLDDDLRYRGPPGDTWFYNTPAYHLLQPVLESASGMSLQDYSDEVLFGVVGISSAVWTPRPADAPPLPGADQTGLTMTPRDMARFGLLVLAGGSWAGRPVVDAAYLRTALTSSQADNPSYGLLWWLNGQRSFLRPVPHPEPVAGPIVPSAPSDLVAALGADDQKVYLVPSLDLVVVRQGAQAGSVELGPGSFDDEWW